MTDLGNKVMESMFDAWCDDRCKEITPDHNDSHLHKVGGSRLIHK